MTYVNVQNSQQQNYGELPANLEEQILWYKLCADLMGPCKICRKGRENLILKSVTMIEPATGWFEITKYNNNKSMTISNLVETMWLV